jgi:hypothetical protein
MQSHAQAQRKLLLLASLILHGSSVLSINLPLLVSQDREVGRFPQNLVAEASPQGWQRVRGGRSGQRGKDHRKRIGWSSTPERGCQTQPRDGIMALHSELLGPQLSQQEIGSGATPVSSPRGSNESGTPPGCRPSPVPLPGGRRPEKPSATSGYRLQPFGLTHSECLDSRTGRGSSWDREKTSGAVSTSTRAGCGFGFGLAFSSEAGLTLGR